MGKKYKKDEKGKKSKFKQQQSVLPEKFNTDGAVLALVNKAIENTKIFEAELIDSEGKRSRKKEKSEKEPTFIEMLQPILMVYLVLFTLKMCTVRSVDIPNTNNPVEYTRVIDRNEIEQLQEEYMAANRFQDNETGVAIKEQEIKIDDVDLDENTGQQIITGEEIEKVAEEQRYTEIKSIWERFKEWFRGDSQQSIDDNQR